MSENLTVYLLENYDKEIRDLLDRQKTKNRIKERPIKDAALLVLKWREICTQESVPRITLKQGALVVGVAKKSLDDYLLQLRLGYKYGFDFAKHRDSKIGVLRNYNRIMKKKAKESKFAPGRKRKEQEEDYTEMVNQILLLMKPANPSVLTTGCNVNHDKHNEGNNIIDALEESDDTYQQSYKSFNESTTENQIHSSL